MSPNKFAELPYTSAKARFFYAGIFALQRRKQELSQSKPTNTSPNKKVIKKWLMMIHNLNTHASSPFTNQHI